MLVIKDTKRKITFVVDEDVYDKIQLLASESHRSMSNYCSLVLTDYVSKKKISQMKLITKRKKKEPTNV